MNEHRLQTVLETPEFIRQVVSYLNDEQRMQFINYIAAHPTERDLMKDTGGARKIRWAKPGGGKSGGIRVIYYYHSDDYPILLFTAYGKSERAHLSQAERSALKIIIKKIVATYKEYLK